MYTFLIFGALSIIILCVSLIILMIGLRRLLNKKTIRRHVYISIGVITLFIAGIFAVLSSGIYPVYFALPPMMKSMAIDQKPASIPLIDAMQFIFHRDRFEPVEDIGRDPNDVPDPIGSRAPQTVQIQVKAKEVISEIADSIYFNYWTYDGSVPGPMMRVKEGDTVILTLENDESSLHPHNIDLHAVTGPGGGASVTLVEPGESRSVSWLAKHPGLYIYHCATSNVSTHNSHGQYGMILVEPTGGLPEVDKEFYIVQGELYTQGKLGKKGLVLFDSQALLDGIPNYVTFNGRVEDTPRMQAEVGDRIRMYVGNGCVNLVSSFHVIGEIFDLVYPEGAIDDATTLKDVQTTAVLPGGATIVEFTVDVPGSYILVDHALARMNKGAWAILDVTGPEDTDIYHEVK